MIPKHTAVYLLAFFLIPFLVDGKKYRYEESEQYLRKYEHIPKYSHNREGKKHYIKHKHSRERFHEKDHFEVVPPDHTKYIAMARFVVHQAGQLFILSVVYSVIKTNKDYENILINL